MTPRDIQGRLQHIQEEINCLSALLPPNYRVDFKLEDSSKPLDEPQRKRIVIHVQEHKPAE